MQPAGAPRDNAHGRVDTDQIVGGSELLGQMRDLIRRKHYSIRTEQAYLDWAKRYILFHGKRHPSELGEAQIVAVLSYLAVKRKVAASTQNHGGTNRGRIRLGNRVSSLNASTLPPLRSVTRGPR